MKHAVLKRQTVVKAAEHPKKRIKEYILKTYKNQLHVMALTRANRRQASECIVDYDPAFKGEDLRAGYNDHVLRVVVHETLTCYHNGSLREKPALALALA